MNSNSQSIGNFDELIFENRNKAYGAYEIRKSYNDNLSFALFSAISLFGIFTFFAFLFTKNNDGGMERTDKLPKYDTVNILFNIPQQAIPEPEIEKPSPKEAPVQPKTYNLNFTASDDRKDFVEKTKTEVTIIKNGLPNGSDSTFTNPSIVLAVASPVPNNEPIAFATNMPEFNGNLFQYLRDNLKYPDDARYNLTSGTVYLQFVVEKDGSIDNIKVLRAIEDGCTEEAVRVIKSMPKWKPGKNHGEPVRVLYNLPVKFTIK